MATLRNIYSLIFEPNYSNPSNRQWKYSYVVCTQIQTWLFHYYFTFLLDVFPTGTPGLRHSLHHQLVKWSVGFDPLYWSSLLEAVSLLTQRKEGQWLQGSAWSGTAWGVTPMAMAECSRLCSLPLAALVWKFQCVLARMVVSPYTCWLSLSWELPNNLYFSKDTGLGIRTMTALQTHLPFTLNGKSLERPDEFFHNSWRVWSSECSKTFIL